MSQLSDFLREHQGERSVREIGRECGKRGHDVGESTVIPYFNGKHQRPKDKVLVALADVLDVKVTTLRQLAGVPAGEASTWTPPREADLMSDRQRRAVDELIRSFVKAEAGTSPSQGSNVVQGKWGDKSVPPPSKDALDVAADSDE